MKIYKITNEDEYAQANLDFFEKGAINMMGHSVPLFDSAEHFFDYYNVQDDKLNKIFDSNGSPLWEESISILPKEWIKEVIDLHRLYAFPFYLIVDGHRDFLKNNSLHSCDIVQLAGLEK